MPFDRFTEQIVLLLTHVIDIRAVCYPAGKSTCVFYAGGLVVPTGIQHSREAWNDVRWG
jgi:hypothetical protein